MPTNLSKTQPFEEKTIEFKEDLEQINVVVEKKSATCEIDLKRSKVISAKFKIYPTTGDDTRDTNFDYSPEDLRKLLEIAREYGPPRESPPLEEEKVSLKKINLNSYFSPIAIIAATTSEVFSPFKTISIKKIIASLFGGLIAYLIGEAAIIKVFSGLAIFYFLSGFLYEIKDKKIIGILKIPIILLECICIPLFPLFINFALGKLGYLSLLSFPINTLFFIIFAIKISSVMFNVLGTEITESDIWEYLKDMQKSTENFVNKIRNKMEKK